MFCVYMGFRLPFNWSISSNVLRPSLSFLYIAYLRSPSMHAPTCRIVCHKRRRPWSCDTVTARFRRAAGSYGAPFRRQQGASGTPTGKAIKFHMRIIRVYCYLERHGQL